MDSNGNKCNKYFLGIEAKKQSDSVIRNIKCSNNKTVTNSNDIMLEIASYYENLFKSKCPDPII